MTEFKIKLTTIEDVRDFVNKVGKYNFPIDLKEGRYIIDAKSIMGIFSLDLLKPITLEAQTDDPAFKDEFKNYII